MQKAIPITEQQHSTQLNINLAGLNNRLGIKTARALQPSDFNLVSLYTPKTKKRKLSELIGA